ncbi:MAG TPA: hypothetical protein PKK99_02805 [Bacteroidia bacterium]|nr:hypothetical protein [Bacteroidia bacterium]HNP97951.1 hypothetical protein [Bacteroidia bacterium]
MKKFLFLSAIAIALLQACYYDNFDEIHPIAKTTECTVPDTVSFANDVLPIFVGSCGTNDNGCHQDASSSGLGLANYVDVQATIDDATEADFLARIKHESSVSQSKWMPKPSGKLSDCDISKIEKWFTQGRLNN